MLKITLHGTAGIVHRQSAQKAQRFYQSRSYWNSTKNLQNSLIGYEDV
jgi:hypothetical protein